MGLRTSRRRAALRWDGRINPTVARTYLVQATCTSTPTLPESAGAKQLLRTMAAGQKPVFLSEYGVGSLFDAVTALAEATCYTASADGAAARFPRAA